MWRDCWQNWNIVGAPFWEILDPPVVGYGTYVAGVLAVLRRRASLTRLQVDALAVHQVTTRPVTLNVRRQMAQWSTSGAAKLYQKKHFRYYRPQRSCGQGNIFTPVCHSVHRGGLPGRTPPARENLPLPGRTHPRTRPPRKQTAAYDQQAASTHPTGMHSCCHHCVGNNSLSVHGWAGGGKVHTPPRQIPPGWHLPRQTPPLGRPPFPRDDHCSRWYASFWNAFLFFVIISQECLFVRIKSLQLYELTRRYSHLLLCTGLIHCYCGSLSVHCECVLMQI